MKFPVMERKYMRWMLTIKVWFEAPSMKCRVEFWLWSIDLPRHIDELRSWLRWVADFEETKRLYKIITMEVNDMLREYYLNYNCSGNVIWEDGIMAEQFHFLAAPVNDTVINITSWATPTFTLDAAPVYLTDRCRVDRCDPGLEYISKEEFMEKERNWELRNWRAYVVLN